MSTLPSWKQPILFEPFLRPMPWGGQRLAKWLGRPLPGDAAIGEAWLLSDHALHASRVVDGPWAGFTLRQLVQEHASLLLGGACERFPLLIKLLDARENLSIQVHPDDELARRWAPGEGGKSEAWLVLEKDPGGRIYLGFKAGIDRAMVANEASRGTLPLCMRAYDPQPGECYNVPAGTVHALGGGLVVLEVQQTSDATFRLFDWGRVDAQGKPRALHLEAGLACLKEAPPGAGLQSPSAGCLVNTRYFSIHELPAGKPSTVEGPAILIVLGGTIQVVADGQSTDVGLGQAALVPAAAGTVTVAVGPRALAVRVAIPTGIEG